MRSHAEGDAHSRMTLDPYRQPFDRDVYRQPVDWMARLRVRMVQRGAFLTACASAIVVYCASSFREELFWVLLVVGPLAIAGPLALIRTWRGLGVSYDVTWRVEEGGLRYTLSGTSASLSFAQIRDVRLSRGLITIHMVPSGTNRIVAGSPGFDAFRTMLRSACERAEVPIYGQEVRWLGAAPWALDAAYWVGYLFGSLFDLRKILMAIPLTTAVVLCAYYLVIIAWPALLVGIALGMAAARVAGQLARARARRLRGTELARLGMLEE